jgi:hypothetical protein
MKILLAAADFGAEQPFGLEAPQLLRQVGGVDVEPTRQIPQMETGCGICEVIAEQALPRLGAKVDHGNILPQMW